MDFQLTEKQLEIKRDAHEFAEKEIRPAARELDRKTNPIDCFPAELLKKARRFRLATMPKEIGGSGLGWLDTVVQQQEIAWGDLGFAFVIYHILMWGPIIPNLPPELKEEVLPRILNEDIVMAAGLHEPDISSAELRTAWDDPMGCVRTWAERDGDYYIINGKKNWSSNGAVASYILLTTRTREGKASESLTQFLVPVDTPGFSVAEVSDHLGCRLLVHGELHFDNMRLPAKYRMGEENAGLTGLKAGWLKVNLLKNSHVLGTCIAAYETALDFARSRISCGKPITEYPTIKAMLSQMKVRQDAAQFLVYRDALNLDNNPKDTENNLAREMSTKAYLNDIAARHIRDCDEIMGGFGTSKAVPLEKLVRDLQTMQHAFCNRTLAYIMGAV